MKNPKLLYVSCHGILEYDELRMFRDIGISFFSLGTYMNPKPSVSPRPPLDDCNIILGAFPFYHEMCNQNVAAGLSPELHGRIFTKEFLDCFDVIVIMHIPDWIEKNWKVLKGRNVIWRTIGQSTPHVEARLKSARQEGLKIVRYSPKEREIPGYLGEDALIRFGKYKEDFLPWTGELEQAVTIGQSMKQRGWFCNYDTYNQVIADVPAKLYGHGNEGSEIGSYQELVKILSQHRVYFYTGTKPASYTLNFIEATMAGIPIVAMGNELCLFEGHDYLEVPTLLDHFRSGFHSNTAEGLKQNLRMLLSNREMAEFTSHRLGKMAGLFDAATIKPKWESFFNAL